VLKKCVAVIPARGGSQRIPRKNIKLFYNKPMISYSIKAALESGLFEQVIVSTDDEEIAIIARACGAKTPFIRPAELADGLTGLKPVVDHALDWLKQNENVRYQYCCMIYATAPFLRPEYIKAGYKKIVEQQASAAISVATMPFPAQRCYGLNKNENLYLLWPEYFSSRSQDLPESFQDAAQFNWVNLEKLSLEGKTENIPADIVPIILPRYVVQDIDTTEDWEMAELMYHALKLKSERC